MMGNGMIKIQGRLLNQSKIISISRGIRTVCDTTWFKDIPIIIVETVLSAGFFGSDEIFVYETADERDEDFERLTNA